MRFMMMEQLAWRKATASGANNACVELACRHQTRLVRDSKNTGGPVLSFPTAAIGRLLSAVRQD
jgi:Domain of unknown function (DUF397)